MHRLRFTILFVLIGLLASTNAFAQKKAVAVGGEAETLPSEDIDSIAVAVMLGFSQLGMQPDLRHGAAAPSSGPLFDVVLVGRVTFGREHNGGTSVTQFLGGVQLVDSKRFKYPLYIEMTAGIMHFPGGDLFPGESDFVFHPAVGLKFPLNGKSFKPYVQVGLSLVSFGDGFHETGKEIAGGIIMPIGK